MGLKTKVGEVVVDSWYDRTSRNWVTQIVDERGVDLPMSRDAYGPISIHLSDYNGTRADMKASHDAAVRFAEKEYGEKGPASLTKLYEKALLAVVKSKNGGRK